MVSKKEQHEQNAPGKKYAVERANLLPYIELRDLYISLHTEYTRLLDQLELAHEAAISFERYSMTLEDSVSIYYDAYFKCYNAHRHLATMEEYEPEPIGSDPAWPVSPDISPVDSTPEASTIDTEVDNKDQSSQD